MSWKDTNDLAFAIATETTQAVALAKALVRDAEIAAVAKVRAVKFTKCRGCQALLENFMISYPDCSDDAVQSYLEDVVFLDCTPCTKERDAWHEMIEAQYQAHIETLDDPSDWERQNLEVAE